MRLLAAPLAALALAAVAAPPAAAKRDSATAGEVTATLTWREGAARDSKTHLVITRAGVEELSGSPRAACGPDDFQCERPWSFGAGDPLVVRDLDADGEPEVVVALFSGGAHCCAVTNVYRWDGERGEYASSRRNWGNPAYRLRDADGDGTPEFVSGDDRFSYAFSDYASSRWPLRVYAFRAGELADVTADHAPLVRRHARALRREYLRQRRARDFNLRGILAAYLADKHALGEAEEGWRLLRAALRRGDLRRLAHLGATSSGRRYLRVLRQRLERWGYA